ncbi:MAG TPA: GAF domain-containing sensor histidine kinase [Anaerolineales bacterium]|nr:GAF domain-containing sensor histidine kinase [Anaerolineales bacterium]
MAIVLEPEKLLEISRQFTSTLQLDDVLRKVLSLTVKFTNAEYGSVFLLNSDGRPHRGFIYGADSGEMPHNDEAVSNRVMQDGLAGWVFRNRQSALIENTDSDSRWLHFEEMGRPRIRSAVAVPIMLREKPIGVITLVHSSVGFFSEEHLDLLETIAGQASTATENAALYTRARTERSVLHAVISGVRDAILVTDSLNRVMLVNASAREILKMPEFFEGQLLNQVVSEPAILNLFQLVAEDNAQIAREIEFRNGRSFDCALVQVPKVGKVLSMHDITTLKHLDAIKSEFVSQVAHDLKAPLAVIHGYAWLLNDIPHLKTDEKEYVEQIIDAVERMRNLIENILDLGRIEMGIESEFQALDMSNIIQTAIQNMLPMATKKHIRIIFEPVPDYRVFGAPLRLEQALANLIGNAIKFSPDGSQVVIQTRQQGAEVIITIRDQGPGIPANMQSRLFQKFSKLGQGTTQRKEGHGLGLAIVRSVVEAHKGRVWVDSEEGRGSVFGIALPVYRFGL